MKEYIEPEITIELLEKIDIVTASTGQGSQEEINPPSPWGSKSVGGDNLPLV